MKIWRDKEIKPFLKIAWVSEEAKNKWSGVINEISQMVQWLEIESVRVGQRKAGWRSIKRSELVSFSNRMNEIGLIVVPVREVGNWGEGFAHKTIPVKEGKGEPLVYTIITKKMEIAMEYKRAFEKGDNDKQGELLGFPGCCRKFFAKVWREGYIDPIWQVGLNSKYKEVAKNKIRIYDIDWRSNPMLRYIGIRISFHIPCSFKCKDTIRMANERLSIIDEKRKDLIKVMEGLLRMPMSWDVYRGVAVIRTPIFYIVTNSVFSKEKYVVEVKGDFIPREGKYSDVFPFSEVKR